MLAHSVQTASPDASSKGRGPDCWVGRDQVQGAGRGAFTLSLFLVLDAFLTTGPEWVAQVRRPAPGAEPRTDRVADEHGEYQPLAPRAPDWCMFYLIALFYAVKFLRRKNSDYIYLLALCLADMLN
ncbi:hypothetical protein A4R89_15650 (plasmid) [Acetobacter ascendens]|nr:hypothetical protein A4R89_15650 [Acetobacter ascendens]